MSYIKNRVFFRRIGLKYDGLESRLKQITGIICEELSCVIATINLVNPDNNTWFKSFCSKTMQQTELDFCPNALDVNDLFIIEDTLLDKKFSRNPMVMGEKKIRFYAGLRLLSPEQSVIGTLCIMDNKPRSLDATEKRLLKSIARILELDIESASLFPSKQTNTVEEAWRDLIDIGLFERLLFDEDNDAGDHQCNGVIAWKIHGLDNINFRHGPAIVSKVTHDIFCRIYNLLEQYDTAITRLDKDIFAGVLFENGMTDLPRRLDEIQQSFRETYYYNEHQIDIKLSFVTIEKLTDFRNLDGLMAALEELLADALMHKNVLSYESPLAKRVRKLVGIRQTVKEALLDNKFTLYYQPKVAVENCELSSFEALLRWNSHEMGGFVNPMDIVNTLDQLMLSNELIIWLLKQVISDMTHWNNAGLKLVPISINISFEQLKLRDFAVFVQECIELSGLSPDLFSFEIVEKTLITNDVISQENMKLLSNFGIKFSIDDFGTDYSALRPLQFLPLSELKIDRSFITEIENNKKMSSLVHSIITIAHNAGLKVVAEGVENFNQFLVMRALGCDQIQGYYFSRPLPFEETRKLLASDRIFELKSASAA